MRLIVLASDTRISATPSPTDWVLRLVGIPQSNETPPPNLLTMADQAAQRVRETFPIWLWNWVSLHDILDLQIFNSLISWWWYTPLSETSPLRSPLIRELYWLALLRRILETGAIDNVQWHGNDSALADVAEKVATRCQVKFEFHPTLVRSHSTLTSALARRILSSASQIARWFLLRVFGFAQPLREPPDVIFYSRFPVLWERREPQWHERMFGSLPTYLQSRNHSIAYAAVFTASLSELIKERHTWRERCRAQNISILEAQLSPASILRVHLSPTLLWRYFAWRRTHQQESVRYDDLDIGKIFWRELNANALSPEIPFDNAIACGFRSLIQGLSNAHAVFLPFEFQPMERAVWTGVRSVRAVPLIGVQTGLYTSNQMGFQFPRQAVRAKPNQHTHAPLPDVLTAYGEFPYHIFAERLGEERVCLSGGIRYSYLADKTTFDRAEFCAKHKLPNDATFILITTSLAPEESLPMLSNAFAIASERPDIFLLLKFHYHLPLFDQVEQLVEKFQVNRYAIFESDLPALMRLAPILLVPGSSTGIEAIAVGTMPVVFRSPGEMSSNPMLDVPNAVFFWHTLDELRQALMHCLERDAEYERRTNAWQAAIATHLYRLDGRANERLERFLQDKGIL
ncbi:MAG: hypothetical protein HZB51_20815 [Chloroflexi bacterium]|nr:hypothetical protein [Chloroflexota bacterium]